MGIKEKIQEDLDIQELLASKHEIILHNDDVNTFDFVIESLISVCEHTLEQAEQCTVLVHYKGKCAVKTGEFDELKSICAKLQELGLSAELH
ncbi:ATP-dependent Clp protease adaptor ClpS [Flavicella sp.]|uniref:ATP-dependent Clp protease adaptor ClpS n=1 Tax=Flavicella sp. TaxID=2957742 RepID=UPI00301A2D9E